MLNDRKDDYEGSDDSEYHFSDDEVSYDADAGPAKTTTSGVSGAMETAGKSKKVLISFGVFIALIFVVYKMVAPGSSTPTTDIAPQAAAPAPMQASSAQAPAPSAAAPVMPVASQQASANPSSALQQMAATQEVQQTQQSLQAQQALQQAQLSAQQAMQNMQNMNSAPQAATAQPAQASPQAAPQAMPEMQQAASQAQQAMSQMQQTMNQSQQSAPQQAVPQQAPPSTSSGMPAVMPIQSPPAAQAVATAPPAPAMPSQMQNVDTGNGTVLAAENARLAGQLQAEYTQRIADYQAQNKNLVTQVEALNSRVASMETEMSQLIQTLTQQFQGGTVPAAGIGNMQPSAMPSSAPPPASAMAVPPEQAGPPPRVPYSVQAIIPGRAWLRANNGDTVTVAEGDEIKGVGRVTKIDPYDGVVELNVQGRAVSLSYGNGT